MRSLLAYCLLMPLAVSAQPSEHPPVFEAASIKMVDAKGGSGHSHENDAPGLSRGSMTLKSFIMAAYNVKDFQVIGGPNWIDVATYEILGKLERTPDVSTKSLGSTPRNGDREEELH
jgi:uncharacterized protein (TIGR03435 family)